MTNKVTKQALAYLQNHQVMTLATTGQDGVWAAAVFYVNDGYDLYFLSAGHTRHATNMAHSPRVAATVQEDYKEWTTIQGIQLGGVVHKLNGNARQRAIDLFQTQYTFLSLAPLAIQKGLAQVNWYCLRPETLYFIDNSKGFGHRDEILLPVSQH